MAPDAESIKNTSVTASAEPPSAAAEQDMENLSGHARQGTPESLTAATSIRNRSAVRLAWFLAIMSLVVTVSVLAIDLIFTAGDSTTLISSQLLTLFIIATYAGIGALVASRHPRNPIGWMFLAVSLLYALGLVFDVYRTEAAAPSLPWLLQNLWLPAIFLPTIFVFLLFPNGRLISRRWRIVLWSAVLGLVGTLVGLWLHPGPVPIWGMEANPSGIPALTGLLDIILQLALLLLVIGLLGSIAAFVIRLRRSRGIERQQMKWLSYAVGLMLLSFALGALAWILWADSGLVTELSDTMTNLAILGIAVATGIAILRYRLYDIDVVINRTLVYGALTATIVLTYVLLVVVLGTYLQVENTLVHSLIVTGLIAVLFQPLRARLQRAVNRLMYGERDEPFEALDRLGRRLEGIFSPEMVYPTIVETVAQALKLPYVALAVRRPEGFETAEAYGSARLEPVAFPLTHQGDVVGQLLVSRRSPDEKFSSADERLLRNFARQAGAAVHAVQLTADLQRSRQQLVTTREEERLRLRRDLHDGLGPALASIVWQADSARDMVYTKPSEAEHLLTNSIEQAQLALSDIRRLVYGLRPPALDELGLAGALEQAAQQRQPTSVAIEVSSPLSTLPAAVEVAAYRIVQEALKNAVEHGKARNCVVSLNVDRSLCLTIGDDGLGLPEVMTPGVGLASMRERAEELGGAFTIQSGPEGGTLVQVHLPLE